MKFMKLGSKPDSFQTDGNSVRYVASELATDIVVNVGEVKFYLHKFPLLSKSECLQKLVAATNDGNSDEVHIPDIPGGPSAFEICAKFCYGMTVTLNAYNVVAARCAAEYLGMHETIEKGNLIYKIDDLKVISHCIDSIASKASIDVSRVDWSYTYNRKKLPEENGTDPKWNGVGNRPVVPKDWWVEDLCELEIDLYKRVIMSIKTQAVISHEVIGEALKAFALKRLPGFSKGMIPNGDTAKRESKERAVQQIVEEFLMQEQNAEIESTAAHELQEVRRPGILSDASKLMVAKLVDGYLAEIAKDPNLPLSKFVDLAELVSGFSRPAHDGLYRAIDMYLKEHPGISKSERKRICRLMDCKKLSVDACMHAVQNERLPLRVVVQVLFFEQVRATATSGSSTPDLPKGIKDLNSASHGSSRSVTTNTEEDWDAVATLEELKALKGELASLRLGNGVGASERNGGDSKGSIDKAAINKMKGLLMSKKIFTKLWSSKSGQGENSGSDSSGSSVCMYTSRLKCENSKKYMMI
ncbi:unnamed protein product, partial [Vitis vinifera]